MAELLKILMGVDEPFKVINLIDNSFARMAELVDALGSGSSGCTSVGVQVPLRAQYIL